MVSSVPESGYDVAVQAVVDHVVEAIDEYGADEAFADHIVAVIASDVRDIIGAVFAARRAAD